MIWSVSFTYFPVLPPNCRGLSCLAELDHLRCRTLVVFLVADVVAFHHRKRLCPIIAMIMRCYPGPCLTKTPLPENEPSFANVLNS